MAVTKKAAKKTAAKKTAAKKAAAKKIAANKPAAEKTLRVTLMRSFHGRLASHKACVRGLGLRRRHQTVEVEDTPCTRGMINKINYLVEVEGQ